ncbi:MAG TPA: ABC transporter permease [Candidatus Eisenbacteria bacterium]|nr:ABC transporter permease [Candidatus Eisenbacteria bacterium]
MRDVLRLVWFDLKQELRPPVWIMTEWLVFTVQLFIYGALITQLVVSSKIANYQEFYAIGFVVMMTFDVGSHTGRHFVEHAHEGLLPYWLSLPISRTKLFLAITLQGGTELALMLAVPLTVTLVMIGNLTVLSIFAAICALFCLGFGVAGLMLGLSFIAFKSSDFYTAIVTGLSTVIIRFSTVLYPLIFLPVGYRSVAQLSPLTYGSDLIRLIIGFDPSLMIYNPAIAVAVLAALAVGTLGLGVFLLQRLVEGVKSG